MKRLIITLFILAVGVCHSAKAAPLSGTKSIGPTGDYFSIGAAIADIQAQSLSDALVLELQAAYVSNVETFPLTIPALNGASATNTVTIRPETGAIGLSISSADTTAATVDLNGAQFVTIDGRPGGVGSNAGSGGGSFSQLTISNTSTAGVALRFINEASNNTIRYTTLRGVNTSASSGVVVFSTTTGANGNDNNTIDHCDIGDGATTPTNCLYALGTTTTTAQNNSGNTVSNCNIFNFSSATTFARGLVLNAGNTDWTITGNSFYQTATHLAFITSANVNAIAIQNPSGGNFTLTGNFIGGSAPNSGGTAWTTVGTVTAYRFCGMFLAVGATTPSSVQGNTIANIVWSNGSNLDALPGAWSGIYVQAGNVNIGTVAGNTIGSGTGTGSVSVTTSGNGGTTFGIGSSSSGAVTIANNTIGSITTNGKTASISASLTGITVTAGTNTISNNTVGSTTTANSLNAATSSTIPGVSAQQVTGISSYSHTSTSITGNTVANLNNNYAGTSSSGQTFGIATTSGVNTITGNTVRNLSTTSASYPHSVLGIIDVSTTAGQNVSQNTVHSLANTAATANVFITGIYFTGPTSGTNVIARNFVHSLTVSTSNPVSVVTGLYFSAGTFTAQNNLVRVGIQADGTSTAGASGVLGIFDDPTSGGRNFYHNSVHVGGTQTSGASMTRAFLSTGSTNARTFQNNIFVNARSNGGGTGKHYAVVYGGTTVNPTGLTAGGNLFYVSGTGGVLGSYNSADRSTLAAWRDATGQDATSVVADPLFINPTGDAATVDLHLQPSNPAEGQGIPIVTVTDDFDGDPRSATTPTIGADEFPQPDITIAQTSALTDGSSVDLGAVNVSSSAALTFTITNPGTADLTSLAVSKDGADAADFMVSALSSTSVAVGSGSATFTVTFSPSAGGARNAAIHIASNVSGAKNPFDIALTGNGLVTQSAWRQMWFGTTANSGDAADTFDFDRDGLVNVLERAFGLNPTQNSAGQIPAGQIIGGNFVISFTQPDGVTGITYGAEWSTSLTGTWNPITDTGASPQHTFSVPVGSGTNVFVRLKVTAP